MHVRLVVGLGAMASLLLSTVTAMHVMADAITVDDLVFVTDDHSVNFDGCDSLVVADARTGRHLDEAKKFISPGRIAVSPGARWITSVSNNNASEPFVVLKETILSTPYRWKEAQVLGDVVEASETVFSPNGEYLLVVRPGRVTKHLVRQFTGIGFGPAMAEIRTGIVTNIEYFSDSRRAIFVMMDGTLMIVDTDTMTDTGLRSTYTAGRNESRTALRRTFAALSPDDRFLLVANGERTLSVIDLATLISKSTTLANLNTSYGIAFDYRHPGRLFAAHGRTTIGVFKLGDDGAIELMASIGVPPQDPQYRPDEAYLQRPHSLAWTGSGDGLAVAIGGLREFRIINVDRDESGVKLSRRLDFEGCTIDLNPQFGLDDATSNDRPLPPSPTPSPPPSTSPSASSTPIDTPTAEPSETVQPTPSPTASTSPTALDLTRFGGHPTFLVMGGVHHGRTDKASVHGRVQATDGRAGAGGAEPR